MDYRHGEIDNFIYKICYGHIWSAVSEHVAQNPTVLDLSKSRIKYPDAARIEDLLLEFTRNISIDEDTLRFDAVVSCTVQLTEMCYDEERTGETSQWLVASCVATVTDKLKRFRVRRIRRYSPGEKSEPTGQPVSRNIVPIIRKDDLDKEASDFLRRYCPEALEHPMAVPIADIAKKMGLEIIEGKRITDDFSIFGEIYFTSGTTDVYDLFKLDKHTINVKRGTILIDASTFWERNLGCVNNTIAHEVFHWHKHRMYASIKHLLYGENYAACRCPSSMAYPKEGAEWTDVERMEWQANSMAPRILMPAETFRTKVRELYEAYGYEHSPLKAAVLTSVAEELAHFYGVSRQSALIRMMETGFKEASVVYDYDTCSPYHSYVAPDEAFFEYQQNREFRELIDSGLFRYVDGYFVVDDERYLAAGDGGAVSLSDYAWSHLDECALRFGYQDVSRIDAQRHFPFELFHRENAAKKASKFDPAQSASAIKLSDEVRKKRDEFERQNAAWKLTATGKTCWELIHDIIQARGMSKVHFCSLTGLGEEVYRKAEKNIPTRPNLRTIVAIACGLDLDIGTTEKLMQLAGHAFDETDENQALRFCITGFIGRPIEEANAFLQSYGYEPLGSKQRL